MLPFKGQLECQMEWLLLVSHVFLENIYIVKLPDKIEFNGKNEFFGPPKAKGVDSNGYFKGNLAICQSDS